MKSKIYIAIALLLIAGGSIQRLVAQQKPEERPSWVEARPKIASQYRESDPSSVTQSVHEKNRRFDAREGVLRALYRIEGAGPGFSGTPEQQARAFLTAQAIPFGFDENLEDLELLHVDSGRYSHHVTFQQTFRGLPVYNRRVKVNLNAAGIPTLVMSGYVTRLNDAQNLQIAPSQTADAILQQARDVLETTFLNSTSPRLVVYPDQTPRLAWQLIAWPESPAVELEMLFDAHDGALILAQNLSTHAKGVSSFEFRVSSGASTETSTTGASVRKDVLAQTNSTLKTTPNLHPTTRNSNLETRISGTGLVFDPDPLSSSGFFYGEAFSDNDDADLPDLNAQQIEVELKDISLGNDAKYRLNGPFVRIVAESSGGAAIYTPPAESSPDGFKYARSNDFFEAVNVYYHIDKSQRYLQSLDVGRDIQNNPIPVNPHGLGVEDNSRYFSNQNYIAFGLGGVDDAEDAHVIWHEYGHALLEDSAPGLLRSIEGQALHEGWADYWATSYARSLVDDGTIQRDDWESLFKWDSGDGSIWAGREMGFSGKYPDDTHCDEGGFQCDIYLDGLLWASTLMEIYDNLGRQITDRLSLASHVYLEHPVTFRDAAEALIQADADLYAGEHVDALIQTLNARGLIDLDSFGPLAYHEPITASEQLGGTIPLSIKATGISAPIENVFVVYSHQSASDTTFLSPGQENMFAGQLPMPASPGTVNYYAVVIDELGLQARLPSLGSGQSVYTFEAGPDTEAPSIQHIGSPDIALVDWPAQLIATVEDNLGVESVLVDYYIDGLTGTRIAEGNFELTLEQGRYKGAFPVSVDQLEPGSVVQYRITARDQAVAVNETHFPENGYLSFAITIENGIFRSYDFETELEGFEVAGSWQRGTPQFGLQSAHSGRVVWAATRLDGPYPDVARQSSLEIPPLNLQGLAGAYLVFWHWFDTEHGGDAFPESPKNTVLWDGGNIKISQDGGTNWAVIEPAAGYNGTIASGRGNPMEGQPAFGGYSYGWRQVVVELPTSNVRIRFDFGTDAGNDAASISYAGWYIDDISILASLPEDSVAPEASLISERIIVHDPGQPPTDPLVEATDNIGIAAVFVDYNFYTDSGVRDGRFRLAMTGRQQQRFTAPFPAELALASVGDSITYRVTATDFAGNSTVFPLSSEAPYRIEYRLRDSIDLLGMGQATGLWKSVGETWAIASEENHQELSSIVFGPLDLPTNVDNMQLALDFQHQLLSSHGGNLKISTDAASTWQVLQPAGGYNALLPSDETVPASMQNQEVFSGLRPNLQTALFDMLDYSGRQVWLRIDFAARSELAAGEYWRILDAAVVYSTLEAVDGGFDVPREFALHANFPDPFASTTTLSYTLSESTPVKLEVYDVLGRRTEVLADLTQPAGTYTISYDASGRPNGLYFLRLTTNQGQAIERMMVSR